MTKDANKPGPKSKKLGAAAAAVTNRLTAPNSASKRDNRGGKEEDGEVAPPAKRNKQVQVQDKGRKMGGGGEEGSGSAAPGRAGSTISVAAGKENKRKGVEERERRPQLPPVLGFSDEEEDDEEGITKEEEEMELGEPEGPGTGLQMNQILSKVGTDFLKQMAVKKKRIESCFKDMQQSPAELLQLLTTHSKSREEVFVDFKAKVEEIAKEAESLKGAQKDMQEKLATLTENTEKHFSNLNSQISGCVDGLHEMLKQVEKDYGDLQGQQEETLKRQLEQMNEELGNLQKKILREGQNDFTR